jgi:hypothetical protein
MENLLELTNSPTESGIIGLEKTAISSAVLAHCQQFTRQLHTTDFRPKYSLEQLLPIRRGLGKITEEGCRLKAARADERKVKLPSRFAVD